MKPVCTESLRGSDSLYGGLLQLAEAARQSEADGQGSILTYGFISAYASRIRITAEPRRDTLVRAQWEEAATEANWDLQSAENIKWLPERA